MSEPTNFSPRGQTNRESARNIKKLNKMTALWYLGEVCKLCGTKDNLEFHHAINPRNGDKTRAISYMLKFTWPRIQKELDNCILLCKPCHTKEHSFD